MLRIFTIFSLLLTLILTTTARADATGFSSRYLKEPAVKWENNRFTGKVKNAPIGNLLVELLQHEGYQWEVKGNLSGHTSINFNDLTIQESVQQIMRLGSYNYTLVQTGPPSSDGSNPPKIEELTIYQDDKIIRFSRTPQKISVPSKTAHMNPVRQRRRATTPVASSAKRPAVPRKSQKTLPKKPGKERLATIDKQLKEMADDMLAKKEMTREEYEELMKEIKRIGK